MKLKYYLSNLKTVLNTASSLFQSLFILEHLNVKHSSFQGHGLLFKTKKKKKGKQNDVSLAFFLPASNYPHLTLEEQSKEQHPSAEISA